MKITPIREATEEERHCFLCKFVGEERYEAGDIDTYCGNDGTSHPDAFLRPAVDEYNVCDLFELDEEKLKEQL
jgi:hypothetical protein